MIEAEAWTHLVTRVLAPNPGPMTLDGTNSLVIRAPGHPSAVVVDPGPDDEHIETLLAAGPVELILLTHHHNDHTESAARLAEVTGAPVRAADPQLCVDAPALADGELIEAGGTGIRVISTPGHTADSVCLLLADDFAPQTSARGSMLTGDTILGRGTTIIARPDGSLGDYFRSLDRLAAHGAIAVVPAHGPMLPDLAEVSRAYAQHRAERLATIRTVLAERGLEASANPQTVSAVVDAVYGTVTPEIRFAAEASALAQLEYLAEA